MMTWEANSESWRWEQWLTKLMPWFCALIAKHRRVEMMTHIRGAPAETQNSFGFLMLCMHLFILMS